MPVAAERSAIEIIICERVMCSSEKARCVAPGAGLLEQAGYCAYRDCVCRALMLRPGFEAARRLPTWNDQLRWLAMFHRFTGAWGGGALQGAGVQVLAARA